MKKPYITLEEALAAREEGRRSIKFLTEDNGCINGCCSGVTICSETEFNPEPGFHDDQEHGAASDVFRAAGGDAGASGV